MPSGWDPGSWHQNIEDNWIFPARSTQLLRPSLQLRTTSRGALPKQAWRGAPDRFRQQLWVPVTHAYGCPPHKEGHSDLLPNRGGWQITCFSSISCTGVGKRFLWVLDAAQAAQQSRILLLCRRTGIPPLDREDPPGEGNGNPLQYSCLENPMDQGVWRATVHGVTESDSTERLDNKALDGKWSRPCDSSLRLQWQVKQSDDSEWMDVARFQRQDVHKNRWKAGSDHWTAACWPLPRIAAI